MRKLYLGNGDKQFKFADTTTEIHLNAFDDGSASALTADAKVRIKNDSGYLLGISASITDNHAVITSGQLAQLPVGSYLIELWNTVEGGTAIYPSEGFLALQINENVTGLSGGLVSSITVDDFIQQFSDLSQQLKQEVAVAIANGLKGDTGSDGTDGKDGVGISSTVVTYQVSTSGTTEPTGSWSDTVLSPTTANPYLWTKTLLTYSDNSIKTLYTISVKGDKGDKGDTGSIDNTSLTAAPAFVKLQTQVDNSAVGTNLIVKSGLTQGYIRKGDGIVVPYSSNDFHSDNYIATNGATTFTLSSPDYVFKGSSNHTLSMYDSDKNFLGYQDITSATQTLSKPNVAYIRFSIHLIDEGGTYGQVSDWLDNHRYKLEKGSVATDWCPNPSEILTQADYAKIQAAIVALGGSLS